MTWRLLLALAGVYAIVVTTIAVLRADESPEAGTSDFRDFWLTAREFRDTGRIRSDLGVHNYLPFFAVLMLPWSIVPLKVAVGVFTLLSLGAFALTVAAVQAMLRPADDSLPLRSGPRPATMAAIGLMLPYLTSCLVVGQVNLLVLLLVVMAWWLVERGHEWEAGLSLGMAILIKLVPAILLVLFFLRGRWRVPASAAATIVLLGLGLPLATAGWEHTLERHQAFFARAVVEHSAIHTLTADKPPKAKYTNQSLPMVLRRLLSPQNAYPSDKHPGFFVNVADCPAPVRLSTYFAIVAGLLVISSLVSLDRNILGPKRTADPAASDDAAPSTAALDRITRARKQFGLWCCLMLLFSPLVWTHYFVLAYFPLALRAHDAEVRTEPSLAPPRRVSAHAVALLIWLIGMVLLLVPAARAAGMQLACVLVLWAVLAWSLIPHGSGERS